MRRLLAAVMLVALAACTPSTPWPPPVVYPQGSNEVVLRVTRLPGFGSPGSELRMPQVTVYGDGRVIEASGDGPTPTVDQLWLTRPGLQRLVEAAEGAQLHHVQDLSAPASDADVVLITLAAEGRHTVNKLVAPALTGAPDTPRHFVQQFLGWLGEVDDWLRAEIASPRAAYVFTNAAILAMPQEPLGEQHEWPLEQELESALQIGPAKCFVLTREKLLTIEWPGSNSGTWTWLSGGHTYGLTLRPLLPHEWNCHQLSASAS